RSIASFLSTWLFLLHIVSDISRHGNEKGYVHTFIRYNFRLSSASTPKSATMQPETLLIHSSQSGVNLARSRLTPPVSKHHHIAEPKNTPNTTSIAER